ncbi:hypothetical protein DICPUDRAFT_36797 [Dictyostelium purpureum]|uniref:ATP synthase subunit d, mitochondrial n=1 Tax=Dictyostelium purpureum TaxID=5786 RepID=F0ZRP5_DICPU|nr:uncharacterized protein DICPUDRAFT_36797 [Dictyostelium purpureum]EGC33377.1 hypothetical protein DICPUDRAFT_36797 [Dictyostelium purpureum]|eukprot:XP_003290085.1 hypothetical protein DICPUDRAFT_36797 [Dictyostelium purpureum]
MFRNGLRLLSKAVEVEAKVAAAPSTSSAPEYIRPYLDGEKALPVVPERKEFTTDIDFADAILSHPVLAKSPKVLRAYNEFMEARRNRASFDALPGIDSTPAKINWEFYESILPKDTVAFFKNLDTKAKEVIDSWATEDAKFVEFVEKKFEADQQASSQYRQSLLNTIQEIEGEQKKMEDFLSNLRNTTFESLEGKYPDLEEEIYNEIENDEWMVNDKVGENTIFNAAKKAHHH